MKILTTFWKLQVYHLLQVTVARAKKVAQVAVKSASKVVNIAASQMMI